VFEITFIGCSGWGRRSLALSPRGERKKKGEGCGFHLVKGEKRKGEKKENQLSMNFFSKFDGYLRGWIGEGKKKKNPILLE